MKRALPAVVAILAAAWWGWPRGVEPLRTRGTAPVATFEAPPESSAPAIPEAAPEPAHQAYAERIEAVAQACDLPVRAACSGETCAGVVVVPDLDRFTGWLRLSLQSPRFVLSTAARDLGMPIGGMPCGVAVDDLVGATGVAAVELEDGTEVWCTFDGSPDEGRSLCRGLAQARLGDDARRFDDPGLRALSFR